MEELKEMLQFLDLRARVDLKSVSLTYILGLTGSSEGIVLISKVPDVFVLLTALAVDDKSEPLQKDAALALINLSANPEAASIMMQMGDASVKIMAKLWEAVVKGLTMTADPACMILSNLTIDKMCCDRVHDSFTKNGVTLDKIVTTLCKEPEPDNDMPKPKLHYLGPFLSNLSQLSDVREELLAHSAQLLHRLLPFTEYKSSTVRRGGVIGAIRNCCFDTSTHVMLLTELDILPRLLLPLAGPTPEDIDESDIEHLPIDLQYLDEDKVVEEDADIRKLLLEALVQLCATKKAREIMRDQSTYFILRELHKTEEDENVKLACENVVDILIKKEDEIQLDNYKDVEVPEDMVEKIADM
jgi:hypothetical protein